MDTIKNQILELSPDDYIKFMSQVHIQYSGRTDKMTNKIINYWKKQSKNEGFKVKII